MLRLRSLISKRIPNKDNYKFSADLTMEDRMWCDRQQLCKAVITRDTVTRLSIPI